MVAGTDYCAKLVNHWNALRSGKDAPSLRVFLDNFDTKLQPWLSVIDLKDDGNVRVRLMGTNAVKLWGSDLTGVELKSAFRPEFIERIYGDHRRLIECPCGLKEDTVVQNMNLETHAAKTVALPLTSNTPTIIHSVIVTQYADAGHVAPPRANRVGILEVKHREWIDVGSGCPNVPPSDPFLNDYAIHMTRKGPEILE